MARPAFKTASESFPRSGNKCLSVNLPFGGGTTSIIDDIAPEMQSSQIESIQSIFIDNSLNASPFSISFPILGQTIKCGSHCQGVFPVFEPGLIRYTAQQTGGNPVLIIFSNTMKPPAQWLTT